MVIASPRKNARPMQSVPQEWADPRDHARIMANATLALQARAILHPVEVVTVTANYTMTDVDVMIVGDATSGNITITLLTAAGREGRDITVKKSDASVNLVTIDAEGAETLDGSLTVGLSSKNAVRIYKSDGVNWQLVSALGNANVL